MDEANEDRFLVEGLNAALRWGDGAMAQRLAEQAGALRIPSAVPYLCALLKPPRRWRQRLRMHRETWCLARVEAAKALKQIGDPQATPALVQGMFDPDARVRAQARAALQSFGEDVIPYLLVALEGRDPDSERQRDGYPPARLNWSLEGMKGLIDLLGALKSADATELLVRVLGGQIPLPPQRWGDVDFMRAVYCTLILLFTLGLGFCSLFEADSLLAFLITTLVCGLIGFIPLVSLVYMFFSLPIGVMKEARERDEVALAAADALTEIKDKRALTGTIEVAFGWRRSVRWTAQWTLLHLLPLLGPEDVGMLPPAALHDLTMALGRYNPRLDAAILRALEFVGTGEAVTPVQHLTRRGGTEEVRKEAARVLPILQARQRQAEAAASLLRASSLPASPAELLRPAQNQPSSPPEQLLRPGQSPASLE
jgi:HEAT repeat protein